MGDMLQDGGNPWRGMLYGMTSRLPWAGDPRALWKEWDDFGLQESRMIGYWVPSCPVTTSDHKVLATVFLQENKSLIAIAGWKDEGQYIHLTFDWQQLGCRAENAILQAPFIKDFQVESTFLPTDPIPIEPGKGWLLILKEEER